MARISTYGIDPNITANDKWIGTDFNTQYTKNFTPQYLADFFNISNSIGVSGQMSFKYYSTFPSGRPEESITTPAVNPNFSAVTSFKIHKNSGGGNYCIDFINYLSGDEILISDTSNADIFGHFKLNSVTQDLSETNFYNLNVTYIGGNGNLQHLKVYSIALYSAAIALPTIGTWGTLNYPIWTTGTPFVKMTAAGTFALDTTTYYPYPTGTTSQYIRGDGTLATFPSVTIPTLQQVTTAGSTTTNEITVTDGSNILSLHQDGTIGFQNAAGGYGNLRSDLLTNYVQWQLPDAYGTIALIEDIQILTPGKNITIVSNAINVNIPPIVNTSAILATTGNRPQGIAIDSSGNIYTANSLSNNVSKITPAGISTILGTTDNYPFSITVDSSGNVYTVNYLSNNVSKITPAGVSSILGTTGSSPQDITLDSLGNVYTANQGSNNVTKITPAGVSSILATTGSSPGGIVIDSLGNIYTANNGSNNVSKITPAGVSTILGTTGAGPRGIVIDTLGNIYTTNNTSNNVSKITPSGVSTILATITSGPFGITIDTSDNIYTCNTTTSNVTKITPSGVSTILGTTGLTPNGIVIDSLGNIYTNNANSNNVTKITVDNKRILAVDDNLNIIRVDGGGDGITSVGLTMPSAFTVTNSPITSSGDIAVTGAGSVSQYVRGDGTLANFPNSTGGGSSVNYYLNGSVSQGTFGGDTYYQMSKTPILGAGTNFTRTNGAGNGYIASFITDAGDPSFLNIPGGNWNLEFYFQSSATGGSPQFYGEIYKVSATNVFTLVASGSANPEGITNGTTVDQYFTSIPVPQTSLLITDRLAVRIYVITSGRTITLHTENGNLCEVLTTFTTGLTALNGLTQQVQYFDEGTSGTDFNISSVTDTHTFNLPTASATNRGALSSTDWSAFNAKTDLGLVQAMTQGLQNIF